MIEPPTAPVAPAFKPRSPSLAQPLSEIFARKNPAAKPEPEPDVMPSPLKGTIADAVMRPLMWSLFALIFTVMVFFVADLARHVPNDAGIETMWLVPSMCSVDSELFNKFVSYIEPGAYADDDEAAGAALSLGAACPAGNLQQTAQEFSLPRGLNWAPEGHNESLVVFRGEGDTVKLSYELRDARGRRLLAARDVVLGPPPTQRAPAATASRSLSQQARGPTAAADDDDEDDASALAAAASPTARRLLKGGGSGSVKSNVVSPASHAYGGRTYATMPSMRVSHTAVHYAVGAGVRTPYGRSLSAAVSAGAFVTLMHHPSGYGRYYDVPGCDDPQRGCELRVAEQLARDALDGNFTVSDEADYPFTLRISQLEVLRRGEGLPSVYLTLYSPTGGVAEHSASDRILSFVWVPLLLLLYCTCKFLAACTDNDDAEPELQRKEQRRFEA